tara:strand:- start:338 stop:739 length:402 start_codon:yes stop_codon:yes gene_type:complete
VDNLVWVVYLIGKLDSFLWLTWISTIVLFIIVVIRIVSMADVMDSLATQHNSERLKIKLAYWEEFGFKRYLIPAFIFILLSLVTPNESSAYKIMAVYGGVELLQTDEAKKLSSKSLDVLNKVMDDYLAEPEGD